MQDRFAHRSLCSVAAVVLAFCLAPAAVASVHVTYGVLQQFETDGFTASWLHSAVGVLNGSAENGALLNGATSSRIGGTLEGDLAGNTLSNASGSVTGTLKQLSAYLNSVFNSSFCPSTPFELRLGGLAIGGGGALGFETNGAGTGRFTGGYLDFSLFVAGNATSVVDGTFFFKPQAESGSSALSPNRGTSSEFTLWGWNWMHDGTPVDGAAEPAWDAFLSGLGYSGGPVFRTPVGGTPLASPLGVALYVVDPDPPAAAALHNPEPTALVIWGVLVSLGVLLPRHRPGEFAGD